MRHPLTSFMAGPLRGDHAPSDDNNPLGFMIAAILPVASRWDARVKIPAGT